MGSRYRRGNPYRNPNEVPKASCAICGKGITYRHYERETEAGMEYICNRGCWDEYRLSHGRPMRLNDDGEWEAWYVGIVYIPMPMYEDPFVYDMRFQEAKGHWGGTGFYLTEGF